MTERCDTCKNCLWYDAEKTRLESTGKCRRYAPRPVPPVYDADGAILEVNAEMQEWPIVFEFDFCGEYKTK